MIRLALVCLVLPALAAGQLPEATSDGGSAEDSLSTYGLAAPPADSMPPSAVDSLVVLDTPNDAGGVVDLFWTLSLDEGLQATTVSGYEVLRSTSPEGPFASLVTLGPGTDRFQDRTVETGRAYYYLIRTKSHSGLSSDSRLSPAVVSKGHWLDTDRIPVFGGLVVVLLVVMVTRRLPEDQEWVLPAARTLATILSRRHPGPTFYVPGTAGLGDMGTIASFTLLEQVLRLRPGGEDRLVIYTADPLAYALASEVMPDEDVVFLSPDQLVFSLAFTGEAFRQRPGAGIVVGAMGSEAFLLSEALSRSGGVAVAGTTDVSDTPFLVATCDLTLIGEEVFLVGPLLAPGGCGAAALVHDRLKLLVWGMILVGIAAAKLGVTWYIRLFTAGGE